MNYEQLTMNYADKNKPNSKPIKPNTLDAQMNVSLAITRNYNNEQRTRNNELLFKTNPNKPNFYQKSGTTCAFDTKLSPEINRT